MFFSQNAMQAHNDMPNFNITYEAKINDMIFDILEKNGSDSRSALLRSNIQLFKKIFDSCLAEYPIADQKRFDTLMQHTFDIDWNKDANQLEIKNLMGIAFSLNAFSLTYSIDSEDENNTVVIGLGIYSDRSFEDYNDSLNWLKVNASLRKNLKAIYDKMMNIDSNDNYTDKKIYDIDQIMDIFPHIPRSTIEEQFTFMNKGYNVKSVQYNVNEHLLKKLNSTIATILRDRDERRHLYKVLAVFIYQEMLTISGYYTKSLSYYDKKYTCIHYVKTLNLFWDHYYYQTQLRSYVPKINEFIEQRVNKVNSNFHFYGWDEPITHYHIEESKPEMYMKSSLDFLISKTQENLGSFFHNYYLLQRFNDIIVGDSIEFGIFIRDDRRELLINPYMNSNSQIKDFILSLGLAFEIISHEDWDDDEPTKNEFVLHKALLLHFEVLSDNYAGNKASTDYVKYMQGQIGIAHKVLSEIGGASYMGDTVFGKIISESSIKKILCKIIRQRNISMPI